MATSISFSHPIPDFFESALSPFLTLDDLTNASQVSKVWKRVFDAKDVWAVQAARFPKVRALNPPDPKKQLLTFPGFGKSKWLAYFGDPGEVPPLPFEIHSYTEAHFLTYIPKTIRINKVEETVTLKKLADWVKERTGVKLQPRSIWQHLLDSFGNCPVEKSHWVFMTKNVLPGTVDKPYKEQKAIIENLGYEVPSLFDAAASILLQYVSSGERYFADEPLSYTRCREVSCKYQVVVGNFKQDGLGLYCDGFMFSNMGMAGMRIFSENPRHYEPITKFFGM